VPVSEHRPRAWLFFDPTMSRKKPAAGNPNEVSLRLRQNAYVKGEFSPAGTVHAFPKAEAEKRLKTTQFWELA